MFNEYKPDILFLFLVVIIPFIILFINTDESGLRWIHKIKDKYFSKSFQNTHRVIFVMCAFFSWFGGNADSIYKNAAGSTPAFIGWTIFTILIIYLYSLLFTYLAMFIKPLFKKLHDFANKE